MMFWNSINFLTEHASDPLVLGSVLFANFFLLTARYLVLNGVVVLLSQKHEVFFDRFRIQKPAPDRQQMLEEIKEGIPANFVFAIMGTLTHYLIFSKKTKIYFNSWDEQGVAYYLLSIAIILIIYDVYFYLIHRYMHHNRWLYAKVHSLHHKYRNPTAYADLALHPFEAFLYVAVIPVMLCFIPFHYSVIGILYLMLVMGNIMGHAGFEFVPKKIARSRLGSSVTFMAFHNFHHSHIHGNFGFALRSWDKMFRTELKQYQYWLEDEHFEGSENEEKLAS